MESVILVLAGGLLATLGGAGTQWLAWRREASLSSQGRTALRRKRARTSVEAIILEGLISRERQGEAKTLYEQWYGATVHLEQIRFLTASRDAHLSSLMRTYLSALLEVKQLPPHSAGEPSVPPHLAAQMSFLETEMLRRMDALGWDDPDPFRWDPADPTAGREPDATRLKSQATEGPAVD
jgi:hypothetical protein